MKNLCLIYVSMVNNRRRQLISMVIRLVTLRNSELITATSIAWVPEDHPALPVRACACEARDLILE